MRKTTAVRVFVGATIAVGNMQSYVPVQHKKATPDVVASYLDGKPGYNPMRYTQDWNRSEARKQELLSSIRGIRAQIRNKAEVYARDRNTKITAVTASQKTALHSEILVTRIAMLKA